MPHMPFSLPNVEFNVEDFGAVGDGLSDDSAAIQTALNAAAATRNGMYGGFVYLPKGTFLIGSQLVIPNGVGLRGSGPASTKVKATNTFNATSMIRNDNQVGGQEYAFLESLTVDGNQGSGAVCSTALVDFVSLFINSYVRDVVIENGSNVGLRIAAAAATGPVYVENTWVVRCLGHNVLFEETASNTGSASGLVCVNLTSEHQASNKSAIYLKGLGRCSGWSFYNTHIEMGSAATGRTGITIDGVSYVLFDGVQLLATASTVTQGILITNVAQNVGIQIRNVININLIDPVLVDQKNSAQIGNTNIAEYATADSAVLGGLLVKADTTGTVHPFRAQNSLGVDKLWIDKDGRVSGNSPSGGGVDFVGDATNDRPYVMLNAAKDRAYGWTFPGGGAIRLRYHTGGVSLLQFDATGLGYFYNEVIFLGNSVRHGSSTGVRWSSGAGTPEGVVTAPVGSLYSRTDGGAATTLYIKESGAGATGWVAK